MDRVLPVPSAQTLWPLDRYGNQASRPTLITAHRVVIGYRRADQMFTEKEELTYGT